MRNVLTFLAGLCLAGSIAAQTVVFDAVNIMEAAENAYQAAEQVAQLKNQLETQLNQWQVQMKQLQQLDPDALAGFVARNGAEMQNMTQAYDAVQRMYGSVDDVRTNFTRRLDTARSLNMSWADYSKYENDRIANNVETAVQQAEAEKAAVERAKRDMEFAQEAADKIDSTEGVHASMNLVNTQVNRMITQQANMIQMMSGAAAASGLAVEAQMQQNEQDQAMKSFYDRVGNAHAAKKASEQRALQMLEQVK